VPRNITKTCYFLLILNKVLAQLPGKEKLFAKERKKTSSVEGRGRLFMIRPTGVKRLHTLSASGCPAHRSLQQIGRGTVSKIMTKNEVRPHKIEYYWERRDSEFEVKMAQVLHVYAEVDLLQLSWFPLLSKLAGAVDLALYAKKTEISPGSTLELRAQLFNGKAGHHIPSGSTEERMLWLEVQAIDATGKGYQIPVDRKGFEGEEYTIADSGAMAYQAMGEIMEIKGFKGVKRDGNCPDGARIFRRPFFDPQKRMTICQWYTADNTLVDYRIGPMETEIENYTWAIPENIAPGAVTIKASLFYSQVPSSVGEFLELPADEYVPILVNTTTLILDVK
jgi:hypothetical protein